MLPYLLFITIVLAITSLTLGVLWHRQRRSKSINCRIAEYVFRNVDADIVLADNNFNVLKTNYYIRKHLGEQQTTSLKIGDLMQCINSADAHGCGTHPSCTRCALRQRIVQAFCDSLNFTNFETSLTILRTDGGTPQSSECCISVTGSHIPTSAGTNLLLTIHDITRLKHIQLQLNDALGRAQESDRVKSLFLANTSHELRTPLNAIVGFSELLADNPTAEEKKNYIGIIRANNELLLQLVSDIIDLSKIEAKTLEFTYAPVDLNAIMSELEGTFGAHHKDDPFEIRFERKYASCLVEADRTRLTQAISHLLNNAVKYTVEGSITFGYENRGTEIYCYVTDTGIGIPKEKQLEIFERFGKAGSHKQGAGIGLTICKSMVDSVGGKIGVVSEPGKGSTFWFTFPVPPLRHSESGQENFEVESW